MSYDCISKKDKVRLSSKKIRGKEVSLREVSLVVTDVLKLIKILKEVKL